MANALDYLDWRGDLSFSAAPFNEVDLFICSQLSTPDYAGIVEAEGPGIPIGEVAEKYFSTHSESVDNLGVLQSVYVLPMLKKLPETVRFQKLKLSHAVSCVVQSNTEQFSAVTVELPDGTICVSFRGTDDTIIGWKEDFHLATMEVVPAQIDAKNYLAAVARQIPRKKIRICGHSKGGNLAVYAAVNAPAKIRSRIISAVSFDGPGFQREFLDGEKYRNMESKVCTVLSQNSIVGTLLEQAGTGEYVHSNKSGPMAHDGFSWEVRGENFVKEEKLSDSSVAIDRAMKQTLGGMTNEERQEFVDELFDTLLATGCETITDLKKIGLHRTMELAVNFHGDKKVHKFVLEILEHLIKSYV